MIDVDLDIYDRKLKAIKKAGIRCYSNDNIKDSITESEKTKMREDLEVLYGAILKVLLIDQEDPNSKETPQRLAKMYMNEVFDGRYSKMPDLTIFPNTKNVDELFTVGPITVRSCCSHHHVPFIGKVWIGILPNKKLLGLSKFARLVKWIMNRPQIQEEAVQMLADTIQEFVEPQGIAIVMKAQHFCMCWRGVKDNECQMTSSVMRGLFRDDASCRNEFFSLVNVND